MYWVAVTGFFPLKAVGLVLFVRPFAKAYPTYGLAHSSTSVKGMSQFPPNASFSFPRSLTSMVIA